MCFSFDGDDDHRDSFGVGKKISASKSKEIHSPMVLWEKSNSHAYMTYTVYKKPTKFNFKYRVQCRKTITIIGIKFSYWAGVRGGYLPLYMSEIGTEKIACTQLFDKDDDVACSTFRLRIELTVENGDIVLGLPTFRSSCDFTEGRHAQPN